MYWRIGALVAYSIVQGGTTLYLADDSGNVVSLALPTGVTLNSSRKPRFAVFNKMVVMVNSPSRPITIDPDGVCRVLTPRPPSPIPTLSAQSGGTLTGTYKVKQTFRIKDSLGNVVAESGYGPTSASQAVSTEYLRASNLGLSPDDVSSTMLYRNLTNGEVFYPWIELDGNTQTSIQDDLADAELENLAADDRLGSAPDLTNIAEWRSRLFGVDRVNIDNLRWTEAGKPWAWAEVNSSPIPKLGSDSAGITGFAARKEGLIVGRRNIIHQFTGNSNTDFRPVKVTENCGIEVQETVQVYRDVVYWLWKDGVYEMGAGGVIKCVSDGEGGKGQVRKWFTTSDYFNLSEFGQAFAQIIPKRNVYRLFLCSAGSSTIDRFVDFDYKERTWWGPHTITGLTPSCALLRFDDDDVMIPLVGMSSGRFYAEQDTRTDDTATAISLDVIGKRHDAKTPNIDKCFGRMRISTVPQTGGRVTITPYVGEIDAPAASQVRQADLTLSSQEVGRLTDANGAKCVQLEFTEASVGRDTPITGYEIEFHELGRR